MILGLETYLTAEAHLKIIDRVKSKAVRVYYDVFNAAHKKHDVLREIKLLGADRIYPRASRLRSEAVPYITGHG